MSTISARLKGSVCLGVIFGDFSLRAGLTSYDRKVRISRPRFSWHSDPLVLAQFQPMLHKRPLPFDHTDWIFELKYDGFRALVYVEAGVYTLLCEQMEEI
jgi:hypothetical protein